MAVLLQKKTSLCCWTFASRWPEKISSGVFPANMALKAEWNHIGPLCHNPTLNHNTGGGSSLCPYVHIITFFECLKSSVLVASLFIMRCTALGARGDWKTDVSVHYRGLKHPIMSESWLAALGLPPVVKHAAAYLFLVLDYMPCGSVKKNE